jgi:hypothetical protein
MWGWFELFSPLSALKDHRLKEPSRGWVVADNLAQPNFVWALAQVEAKLPENDLFPVFYKRDDQCTCPQQPTCLY